MKARHWVFLACVAVAGLGAAMLAVSVDTVSKSVAIAGAAGAFLVSAPDWLRWILSSMRAIGGFYKQMTTLTQEEKERIESRQRARSKSSSAHRFSFLRAIAWLGIICGLLVAAAGVALCSTGIGAIVGIPWIAGSIVVLAAGGVIHVLVAIEENIRSTNSLLERLEKRLSTKKKGASNDSDIGHA